MGVDRTTERAAFEALAGWGQGALRLAREVGQQRTVPFETKRDQFDLTTPADHSIERFLVAAGYCTLDTSETPSFYTFAFLLNEVGGKLGALDKDEQVEDFREIVPDELPAIAEKLDHLNNVYSHELDGKWGEWGRFRAVIHRLVWEALQQ